MVLRETFMCCTLVVNCHVIPMLPNSLLPALLNRALAEADA